MDIYCGKYCIQRIDITPSHPIYIQIQKVKTALLNCIAFITELQL